MPQIRAIQPLVYAQERKLRVAAYARVSSDSADQRNSFAAQVEYYTQFIQNHSDWEFVDIYADEGITGTRADKREDFQRLIADCRAGKIDRILVKSLSRFARNSKDCIQAVRELQTLGISVIFEKEQIDTGHLQNEMILSMMSAFAQEESISISQNMRRGALMRMRNGTFRLSQIPYGYRIDTSGRLSPQPDEAYIVQKIFDDYLSGKGIATIARDLETQQIPKLRGLSKWSKHGIIYILTNERYAGNEMFRKSYRTDHIPFKKVENRGQKSRFFAEQTHPSIVPTETFERTQDLLKKKSLQFGKPQPTQPYSFTRKIRCGSCGAYYYRRVTTHGIQWVCRNHLQGHCSNKGIPEESLKETFLLFLHRLQEHQDTILLPFVKQVEALQDKETRLHSNLFTYHQQMADLLSQSHVLAQLRAQECIDSGFFLSRSHEIQQELAKVRVQMKHERTQNNYHHILQTTQTILEQLNQPLPQSFVPEVFCQTVTSITADEQNVHFHLPNGLVFQENLLGYGHE